MKQSTLLALLTLVLSYGPSIAVAAPKPVVQWSVRPNATTARVGSRFQVVLRGTIDPGWHLYALQEPEGGPVATEIALTDGDAADLLRVEQARPKTIDDPVYHAATAYFEGTADFTLKLQADKTAGPHTLHALVRYQSCNDRVCLPPHTDTIEVPVAYTR